MKHVDFDLVSIVLGVSVSALNLYVFCYFGKMSTEQFEKMADCLYHSSWYLLSNQMQKFVILMIANAQIPIHYHGFKIAVLNLELFCKVSYQLNEYLKWTFYSETITLESNHFRISLYFQMSKTVISYYLMFKTLTSEWMNIFIEKWHKLCSTVLNQQHNARRCEFHLKTNKIHTVNCTK